MKTIEKLPLTQSKRSERDEVIRVAATWDAYQKLMNISEYPLQYHQGEIISVGFAGYIHELIIVNLLNIFGEYLFKSNYNVLANKPLIKTPNTPACYFADVTIVWAYPQYETIAKNKQAILNPQVIIEVLNEDSLLLDTQDKLPAYQNLNTVQQIVLVDTQKIEARVYQRDTLNRWHTSTYEGLFASMELADFKVKLSDLYRGIDLSN